MSTETNKTVEDLISRSNRLGADKRNTNFAGGNTSAKGTEKAAQIIARIAAAS